MTGALRDPDDYARDAAKIDQWAREHHGEIFPPATEEHAAAMWDEGPKDYVGRRRAADDATMALLVDGRVHHYLGNRDARDQAVHDACQRLYGQGHTMASAMALLHRLHRVVDRRALQVMEEQAAARAALRGVQSVADLLGGAR